MTFDEKKKAQEKYDILAEGYKDTIDIIRKSIKKKEQQIEMIPLRKDKFALQMQLSLLRQILRENIETYNFLLNYYNLRPKKQQKQHKKGLFDYTVDDIVKAYRKGNFSLCNKLL